MRAVDPEAPPEIARGRDTHEDYAGARECRLLAMWVPLMAIPVELGSLAMLPGATVPTRATTTVAAQ
jgi:hypothetical protein